MKKIDNALLKRFARQSTKSQPRELVSYFLVVCEGKATEPNYFKSFPKQIGKLIYQLEFGGGGINTLGVVEKAIQLRDASLVKYDRVWAVFDKDSFPADRFNSAILKARGNNINCAWSNEAFELWYLLHFQNRVTPMSRDEYKSELEKAINQMKGSKEKKFEYLKNSNEMYSILEEYGDQEQAIKWAKVIASTNLGENFASFNPQTMVFQLVEELNGQSEELNREIELKFSKGE